MNLDQIDLKSRFESKKEYKKALKKEQIKLLQYQRKLVENKIPMILVFEGWDASGKGGAIKRLTQGLDPRGLEVHSIAAPMQEEKLHHYLHRFWKRLPKAGKIGIFDRSWYGRVLVERVEKLATEEEWSRAYEELNSFEKTLTDAGYIIEKFWLHISKDEQLNRFNQRKEDPLKRWKLTEEDWRNREKWDQYQQAADDMFAKTNTENAPWHIVSGEYKWHARVEVIELVNEAIEKRLEQAGLIE